MCVWGGRRGGVCVCVGWRSGGDAGAGWRLPPPVAPRRLPRRARNRDACAAPLSSRLAQMDKRRMQLPCFVRAVLVELSWLQTLPTRGRRRTPSRL